MNVNFYNFTHCLANWANKAITMQWVNYISFLAVILKQLLPLFIMYHLISCYGNSLKKWAFTTYVRMNIFILCKAVRPFFITSQSSFTYILNYIILVNTKETLRCKVTCKWIYDSYANARIFQPEPPDN